MDISKAMRQTATRLEVMAEPMDILRAGAEEIARLEARVLELETELAVRRVEGSPLREAIAARLAEAEGRATPSGLDGPPPTRDESIITPAAAPAMALVATIHVDTDSVLCTANGPDGEAVVIAAHELIDSENTARLVPLAISGRFDAAKGGFEIKLPDEAEDFACFVAVASAAQRMLEARGYAVVVKNWGEGDARPKAERTRKLRAAKSAEAPPDATDALVKIGDAMDHAADVAKETIAAMSTPAVALATDAAPPAMPSFEDLPPLDVDALPPVPSTGDTATATPPITRPAWLDRIVGDPDGSIGAGTTPPPKPTHASIALDASGLHGSLFDLAATSQLEEITAMLRAHPGTIVEPSTTGLRHLGFKAQFNSVLVPAAEQSAMLKRVEAALVRLGFVVDAVDWNRQVVTPAAAPAQTPVAATIEAFTVPSTGEVLHRAVTPPATPAQPALSFAAPAGTPGDYRITLESEVWIAALDANQRAKVKRTLRKAGIAFDDAPDMVRLVTHPFPRSNAGAVSVLGVLREMGVATEPEVVS